MSPWARVWAAIGAGAPRSAVCAAGVWVGARRAEESLRAWAARAAAQRRFLRHALALVQDISAAAAAADADDDADASTAAAAADAADADAWGKEGEEGDAGGEVEQGDAVEWRDARVFAAAARGVVRGARRLGMRGAALRGPAVLRALAGAALPVALGAAAPSTPALIMDAVHCALCTQLIAIDLCRDAAQHRLPPPHFNSHPAHAQAGGSPPGRRRSGPGPPGRHSADAGFVCMRDFAGAYLGGGGAWAVYEALRRWLTAGADSPGLEPHELLSPSMLPAWVAAAAGGAAPEAAAASAVAAAGLRALAGHEGSRGEAGLRSLAVLLGAAAALQPRPPPPPPPPPLQPRPPGSTRVGLDPAQPSSSSPSSSRPSSASSSSSSASSSSAAAAAADSDGAVTSLPELHAAVRALFTRRKFAPLLRARQGLTLVHFSARLKRILSGRGAFRDCLRGV